MEREEKDESLFLPAYNKGKTQEDFLKEDKVDFLLYTWFWFSQHCM